MSHYEWMQNRSGESWTAEKVRTQMEQLMVPIVDELRACKSNSRIFCYHKSLRNLEKAFAAKEGIKMTSPAILTDN